MKFRGPGNIERAYIIEDAHTREITRSNKAFRRMYSAIILSCLYSILTHIYCDRPCRSRKHRVRTMVVSIGPESVKTRPRASKIEMKSDQSNPTADGRDQASRHAAEVAFTIVAEENALVEVARDRSPKFEWISSSTPLTSRTSLDIGDRIVDRDAELGRQLGAKVVTTVTVSDKPGAKLVDIADRNGADVIVMGRTPDPFQTSVLWSQRRMRDQ